MSACPKCGYDAEAHRRHEAARAADIAERRRQSALAHHKLIAECLTHMRGEDPWKAEREEYQRRVAAGELRALT